MANLVKDMVSQNVTNPKDMLMHIINHYLANKTDKDDMFGFIIKIGLATKLAPFLDFVQNNIIKIFYVYMWKKYTETKRILENYTEVSTVITVKDHRYETLLNTLVTMTKNISVKYSFDMHMDMISTVEYLNFKKVFDDYSLKFESVDSNIKVIATSKKLNNIELLEKINNFIQDKVDSCTEVSICIEKSDQKYEPFLNILSKMTTHISIKYTLNANMLLSPQLHYLSFVKKYDDYLIEFKKDPTNSDIDIIAKSQTLNSTELSDKINMFLQENIPETNIYAEINIEFDDNVNSSLKQKVASLYIKPKLTKFNINDGTTFTFVSKDDGCLISDGKCGLYLMSDATTSVKSKTLIDNFDDISIYLEATTRKTLIRLVCRSDKYSVEEISKKVLNRLVNIIYAENTIVTPTAPKKSDVKVYQYNKLMDEFVKTGCSLNSNVKIFLNPTIKKSVDRIIQRFSEKATIFDKLGIPKKCGILLYGLPGTGKTTTIKYFAQTLDRSVFMVNLLDVTSNAKLDEIFDKAKSSNGIIVIEDIDRHIKEAFSNKKQLIEISKEKNEQDDKTKSLQSEVKKEFESKQPGKKNKKQQEQDQKTSITVREEQLTFDGIMNRLDGLQSTSDQVFILTSNFPNVIKKLNPAFMRPGRIDYCLHIDFCVKEQLYEIVEFLFEVKLSASDLELFTEKKYATVVVVYALAYYSLNSLEDEPININTILKIIDDYDKQTSSAIDENDDSLTKYAKIVEVVD